MLRHVGANLNAPLWSDTLSDLSSRLDRLALACHLRLIYDIGVGLGGWNPHHQVACWTSVRTFSG